ncbi:MAG: twin-arginine translocation pathway signal, partial [Bacteroidota bacterium]
MLTTGNRRQFLKQIGLTAAGTLIAPAFLHAHDHSIPKFGGRRLVVIQLSGGNDGLNTVVPFRNDILYEARPQLLAKPSELLKVSDELAFNPAMEGFRSLFDQGDLCILNSVGYPNPNRSHFRSMDIW